jgi:hypothetical protein
MHRKGKVGGHDHVEKYKPLAENGSGRRVVSHHITNGGLVNRNEATENNRRSTISDGCDFSKHYEDPEVTDESLSKLEQAIQELSREIAKLLSRIDAAIARLTSERQRLALTNNDGVIVGEGPNR